MVILAHSVSKFAVAASKLATLVAIAVIFTGLTLGDVANQLGTGAVHPATKAASPAFCATKPDTLKSVINKKVNNVFIRLKLIVHKIVN